MNLEGKVSLVTGAAAGQGAGTAAKLAELGATVVLTDVDVERGKANAEALGQSHRFYELDVANESAWESVVAQIDSEFGRLDTVHLNAGIMSRPNNTPGFDDPMTWFTSATYRRVSSVNSDGVVLGLIHTLPLLERDGGGRVIVTSSTAGLTRLAWDPLYCMAKTGVIALVRSMGPLLAERGVVLTGLCPEGIVSEMCPPDLFAKRIAEGRPFASVEYLVEGTVTVLDQGTPGEIWLARRGDGQYWTWEPSEPPAAGSVDDVARVAGRRVPSTTGS